MDEVERLTREIRELQEQIQAKFTPEAAAQIIEAARAEGAAVEAAALAVRGLDPE
jgi:hypothetical protein